MNDNRSSETTHKETDLDRVRDFLGSAEKRTARAMSRVQMAWAKGDYQKDPEVLYREVAADLRKIANFIDVARLELRGVEAMLSDSPEAVQ